MFDEPHFKKIKILIFLLRVVTFLGFSLKLMRLLKIYLSVTT